MDPVATIFVVDRCDRERRRALPLAGVWQAVFAMLVLLVLPLIGAAQSHTDALMRRRQDERLRTAAERQAAAASFLELAARLRHDDPRQAAELTNRAARLQDRLAAHNGAAGSFQEALRLARLANDPIQQIESLNGQSSMLAKTSRCDEAEPLISEAISLSELNNYVPGKAEALFSRSNCERYHDHALGLRTAQEALALFRSIDDSWGIATASDMVGQFQFSRNDLVGATASFQSAASIWRDLEFADGQTRAVIYLGFIEYRKGAWQNVIAAMAQAQALIDEASEHYKMGQITMTLGETMVETGAPEAALGLFQRAKEYFRLDNNPSGMVVAEWDIGKTYYSLGKYPEALSQLSSALAAGMAIKQRIVSARCHDYLGRTYAAMGDQENALREYQTAVEMYESNNDPMEVARTNALIGRVYQQQGQAGRARELYQQALATFDRLSDQVNQSVALFALGELDLDENKLDQAEDHLLRSIQVTENLRRSSQSADLTAAFSATVHDRYQRYVECLMLQHAAHPERDVVAKAFEASELGRSRSLAELLRGTDANLLSGVDPQLSERERTLRQLLRAKADQQVTLLGRSAYKKEELDALTAEQAQLEAEYRQVTDLIRQRFPAFGEIVRPAAWSLPQIQEQVITDDQTLLLEYSLGGEKSYVWAVTRDGFSSYELPGRTAIEQAAKTVYAKMSAAPSPTSGAELLTAQRELSRLVLAPVAGQLNKSRIIVVADGVLNYIPFQSLPDPADNARLLVEKYEVINAASASVLGALGKESATRPAPTKLLAAFGNPVFQSNYAQVKDSGADTVLLAENDGNASDRWRHALRDIEIDADSPDTENIQPLIYSIKELSNLRAVGGGDSLIASEFNASRENVMRTDLSQYSILHFATHGFLDPKRPENSGLVLSTVDGQRNRINGYLGLQDIYSLRAPVDLVVLSACRTGLGKDVKGEGLIGLTRGFMYAGASTVVASLWKVDDEATAALMKEFYDNLLHKGLPPAAALREAQNTIRSKPQWSSPYYWAAFTIQGEYRTPIRTTRAPLTPGLTRRVTAAAAILGILTFVAWYSRRFLSVPPAVAGG